MRNNSKLFKQIILNLPNYIFWKDNNLIYRGCNYNFARAAGFDSPDQVIGKSDEEMRWAQYTGAIYQAEDMEIIKTGKPILGKEVPMVMGEGQEQFLSISKVPLYGDGPDIIGVLGIYIDITKQKEMEKILTLAKEKAEAANRAKSDFIHNMEHDIRTPFNGVWGFANILAERETDPEKKEYITLVAISAKELLDYCDSILDFSRIESGIIPILEKAFNPQDLIESLVKIEAVAAKLKELPLTVEYDSTFPKVLIGDPYRIKRILLNLLSNAIKFTEKGYIKLSASIAQMKENQRDCIVKFTITDTGIGISKDKKEIIYEKFTRGTPSNKGLYKGQGLGLHIVKQFVSELDGEIHLKTEIDKGTAFTILIPCKLALIDGFIDEE